MPTIQHVESEREKLGVQTLDATDRKILAGLRKNPQVSNKSLSATLNVTEATIAARIERLISNRVMKVTVQRDIRTIGYTMMGIVDVYVEKANVTAVGEELGQIEHIVSANLLSTPPQIILFVAGKNMRHMLQLLERDIAAVQGVQRCELSICLDVVKFAPGLAAL